MAKEKKPQTLSQQKKHYKRVSRLCFAGEFVSAVAPYGIISLVNFESFFVHHDGLKISIGGILAIGMMCLVIGLISKKKLENSFVPLLFGWAVGIAALFLLDEIIEQLKYIMLFGWVGLVGAFGLDKASKANAAKAAKKQKAIEDGELQMDKDAYIQEKQEQQAKPEKKKIVIIRKK